MKRFLLILLILLCSTVAVAQTPTPRFGCCGSCTTPGPCPTPLSDWTCGDGCTFHYEYVCVPTGPTWTPTEVPSGGEVASDDFERSLLGSDWIDTSFGFSSANVASIAGSSDLQGEIASGELIIQWDGAGTLTGDDIYGCVQITTVPTSDNSNIAACLGIDDTNGDAVCGIFTQTNWYLYEFDNNVTDYGASHNAALSSDGVTLSAGDCLGLQGEIDEFQVYYAPGPDCDTWQALGGGPITVTGIDVLPGNGGTYLWTVSANTTLIEHWAMGTGPLPTDGSCAQ